MSSLGFPRSILDFHMICASFMDRIPKSAQQTQLTCLTLLWGHRKILSPSLHLSGGHRTSSSVASSVITTVLLKHHLGYVFPASFVSQVIIPKSGCRPFYTGNPPDLSGISTALAIPWGINPGEFHSPI